MASGVSSTPNDTMDVVVIGGSISGLMHAIMLRSLGHNVRILEQQDSSRSDYGAGLGVGPQGRKFLDEFDRTGRVLTYQCPGFKFLGPSNEVTALAPSPMHLTSWTALYYRLRGLYDGSTSPFCPQPPPANPNWGPGTFEAHKKVIGVTMTAGDLLEVTYEEHEDATQVTKTAQAHLVIDASGPYSMVRSSIPSANLKPEYAGFIAWRGTVADQLVSEETNQLFDTRFNIFTMADGNYCIGYAVPGETGSLELGQRQLNWIWYMTETSMDELHTILTDREGHRHSNSVPRGQLNIPEWVKRRDAILPRVNKAFAELMCATNEPFVSTIRESFIPQRAFFDGRLLLVGDGANLMRPNGGQATNHAASQCLALRDVLRGEITMRKWEAQLADQGWQMRLFSNTVADRFLYGAFWGRIASLRLAVFSRWLQLKTHAKRILKL